MAHHENVVVDAPVSVRLLHRTVELTDVWTRWIRGWHRSRVSATAADRRELQPAEVAACLSGGLDSFYTVLRERPDDITALITLRRFDETLHPPDHEERRMELVAR